MWHQAHFVYPMYLKPKRMKLIRPAAAIFAALLMFLAAERVGAADIVYVPGDYPTIQQAVNASVAGDTIIVRDGCYAENIIINKSDLTIKSQDGPAGAIVSSGDGSSDVFQLNRPRTTISGFTIKNAVAESGINVGYYSSENVLENNKFLDNERGIYISLFSYLNNIRGNDFIETNNYGLYFQSGHDSGSGTVRRSSANSIYLNDFYSKIQEGAGGGTYHNFWATGEKKNYRFQGGYYENRLGNFYAFYSGSDDNGDGIGEASHLLGSDDGAYPLVEPITNYQVLAQEPDWTFAVLTDLHIGWGIPDYGQPGYSESDSEPGQDYFMTERLNAAVNRINERKAEDNIKFVIILGDITDTAEYSEFLKAREILNKLEIPYLPVIGNHDIVPYISDPTLDPDYRAFGTFPTGIKTWVEGEMFGDQMFEKVFWEDNAENKEKIAGLFENFSKQPAVSSPFQNYYFTYKNIKFVSLDFASRRVSTQLSVPFNAVDNIDTLAWLNSQLNNCGDSQTVLLTHYPLRGSLAGFIPSSFDSIEEEINSSLCQIENLAGHTHVNNESIYNNRYSVVETEALSQIAFWPYENQNKFLRLVKVKNNGDIQTIDVDNFATGFSSAINPYITAFPGNIGPNMPINFEAGVKNRRLDEIASYTWQFDGEPSFTTRNKDVLKLLLNQGLRKVKVTVKDIYGDEETVSWNYEVKEETRLGRKMVMVNGGTLVPMLYTGIDLRDSKYGLNTNQSVNIAKDGLSLIGTLNVHFELANTDIDLSDLAADVDFDQNKSVMHMDNWPSVVETRKILYIPSSGQGKVYICPGAKSLEDVNQNCTGLVELSLGETKNGMFLNTINYEGQDYYQVMGITGTGGGEWINGQGGNIKSLEEQIEITKLVYDGEDILSRTAQDIGDHQPPLLLSELKQGKINLTGYLPLIKKLLLPFQTKTLEYKLKFQNSIGNEWQGKKIKLWFNFEAEQEK